MWQITIAQAAPICVRSVPGARTRPNFVGFMLVSAETHAHLPYATLEKHQIRADASPVHARGIACSAPGLSAIQARPISPATASAFAEVREPCDGLASPRARRAQRRPMQGAGGPSSGPGPGEIAVSEYPCLACALQGPFATAPLSQRPQLCRGSVLVMHRCQKSDRKRGPRPVPTAACPRAHLARFARYLLARGSTFVPGNVKGW